MPGLWCLVPASPTTTEVCLRVSLTSPTERGTALIRLPYLYSPCNLPSNTHARTHTHKLWSGHLHPASWPWHDHSSISGLQDSSWSSLRVPVTLMSSSLSWADRPDLPASGGDNKSNYLPSMVSGPDLGGGKAGGWVECGRVTVEQVAKL